jgi:hypothetical protein
VIGTKGARWNNFPFRIVPAFGKLPENCCHISAPIGCKQGCDVFQNDVIGSALANDSDNFKEQALSSDYAIEFAANNVQLFASR